MFATKHAAPGTGLLAVGSLELCLLVVRGALGYQPYLRKFGGRTSGSCIGTWPLSLPYCQKGCLWCSVNADGITVIFCKYKLG